MSALKISRSLTNQQRREYFKRKKIAKIMEREFTKNIYDLYYEKNKKHQGYCAFFLCVIFHCLKLIKSLSFQDESVTFFLVYVFICF